MNLKILTENYRKFMIIPIALLVMSIFFLYQNYVTKGTLVDRSFELEGGTKIIVTTDKELKELHKFFKGENIGFEWIKSPLGNQMTINLDPETDKEPIINKIEKYVSSKSIQISYVEPQLSKYFWGQIKKVIPLTLLGILVVTLFSFRSFIPAVTIIFCVISNIIFILGMMAFFGIELSLATLGGILMILGYSVDDDVLLYSYALKRKEGKLVERIQEATKTGITMSSAALISAACLYLLPGAQVLKEIGNILIFGLIANYPFTWIQSAGILKFYLEKR